MKVMDILGKNRFPVCTQQRLASRGIVLRDGLILLSYEQKSDQWFLPGGGLEAGETLRDCCCREIAEETGVLVSVGEEYLALREYYEEWCYESHFFLCEKTGDCVRKLTAREAAMGLVPRWIPVQEAIDIFSHHADFDGIDEMKRGGYLREFTALLAAREAGLL